jgi:hypothetical protein
MERQTPQENNLRLLPPKEMFEGAQKETVPLHGIAAGQLTTPVYHVELPPGGGVLSYHVGDKYPVKGWPFKEAVYAIDTIKRAMINGAKLLTSSPLRYIAGIALLLPRSLKRKMFHRAAEEFTNYTDVVFDRWGRILPMSDEQGTEFGFQGVCWKPQYYCDMVRELRRVALLIAGDDPINHKLLDVLSMILEFDDAYRYRLQDGFGEIDGSAMLKNPRAELTRVFKLMERRGIGTGTKFAQFAKLIPFALRLKDVQNMVRRFFEEADLTKLSLDEVDWYRCLLWGGYDFKGIPDQERASLRIMIDAEWNLRTKQ